MLVAAEIPRTLSTTVLGVDYLLLVGVESCCGHDLAECDGTDEVAICCSKEAALALSTSLSPTRPRTCRMQSRTILCSVLGVVVGLVYHQRRPPPDSDLLHKGQRVVWDSKGEHRPG